VNAVVGWRKTRCSTKAATEESIIIKAGQQCECLRLVMKCGSVIVLAAALFLGFGAGNAFCHR
jgi:hypothetical protein